MAGLVAQVAGVLATLLVVGPLLRIVTGLPAALGGDRQTRLDLLLASTMLTLAAFVVLLPSAGGGVPVVTARGLGQLPGATLVWLGLRAPASGPGDVVLARVLQVVALAWFARRRPELVRPWSGRPRDRDLRR